MLCDWRIITCIHVYIGLYSIDVIPCFKTTYSLIVDMYIIMKLLCEKCRFNFFQLGMGSIIILWHYMVVTGSCTGLCTVCESKSELIVNCVVWVCMRVCVCVCVCVCTCTCLCGIYKLKGQGLLNFGYSMIRGSCTNWHYTLSLKTSMHVVMPTAGSCISRACVYIN